MNFKNKFVYPQYIYYIWGNYDIIQGDIEYSILLDIIDDTRCYDFFHWYNLHLSFLNPSYIAVTFVFPTCKNIVKYVYKISQTYLNQHKKNCKYI